MNSRIIHLVLFCVVAGPLAAQEEQRVLDAARATMIASRFCFLITVGPDGQPESRLVQPFDPEQDMAVWIGTNRHTRKVAQIRKNSRVTLSYFDPATNGYVTLLGRARLVENLEERKRRWNEGWRPFYPDGPEGQTYLLIEVRPERMEVMSLKHKVASEPLGWKPAILVMKAGKWSL